MNRLKEIHMSELINEIERRGDSIFWKFKHYPPEKPKTEGWYLCWFEKTWLSGRKATVVRNIEYARIDGRLYAGWKDLNGNEIERKMLWWCEQ